VEVVHTVDGMWSSAQLLTGGPGKLASCYSTWKTVVPLRHAVCAFSLLQLAVLHLSLLSAGITSVRHHNQLHF
jgi:hypothetical protein